jgi:hypothetical protein
MRLPLSLVLLCLISTADAKDDPVTLLIAPRSLQLPPSGKIVFDVYWHNWTDKPAAIPFLVVYSFTSYIILPGRERSGGGTTAAGVDHPPPDRSIAPHAVIHETLTTKIELKPKEIGQVSLSVTGERKEFTSNVVVFTRR